jgi:hypothetical protein
MGFWTATIEKVDKTVLASCTTMGASTLTLPLNAPSEFQTSFHTSGLDASAIFTQLQTGAVFIRLRENGTTRFWGQMSDAQVQIEDDATVSATFQDVTGPLAGVQTRRPISFGSSPAVSGWPYYFNTNQSTIVNKLFAIRSGSTGDTEHYGPLVQPVRSGSVTSIRKLSPDTATVLEVLQGMSELANGTEWYASPVGASDETVYIASQMGTDKTSTVVLQNQANSFANVMSITSQYLPPRNIIWVRDDQNRIKRIGYDAASVDAYGEYSTVIQKVNRWSQTDQDVSDAQLRPDWRQILDLKLEPTVSPRPWTDFYLGDTLKIDLSRDGWSYSGSQRVNTITFDFDEQLVESSIGTQFEVI